MTTPARPPCWSIDSTPKQRFFRALVVAAFAWSGLWFPSGKSAALGAQAPAPSRNRAPVADAGGPYSAVAGRAVLLSATLSTDPDGDSLAFAWDFGDGSSASESSPTHTYSAVGMYAVRLLATDSKGGVATSTTFVVVMDPAGGNQPPSAVDNGPYLGHIKEDITMDASGSTDPEGDKLSFAWTFGDGASGSGPSVIHAYARQGTYTVKLLVTDGRGGARVRTSATVIGPIAHPSNHPPVARATGPASAFAGNPVTFNGRDSSDPDKDRLTLTWIFDDGDRATGLAPSHTFSTLGSHTAKLIASDGRGGLHTTSLNISVVREADNQYPISDIGGPYAGVVGVPVAFTASASDPDGDILRLEWDFGDGAKGAASIGDGVKGSGGTLKHAYKKPGTFVLTLLVSDGNGDVVVTTTNVVVSAPPGPANRPPVANAGGPYSGTMGRAVTFDSRGSLDPDNDSLACAWTFGDGSSAAGPRVAHTFSEPGDYAVLLLVTDRKGGSAAALTMATIGR